MIQLLIKYYRIVSKGKINPLNKEDKITVSKTYNPINASKCGFNEEDIIISDEVISHIIDTYTYEMSVENLKKNSMKYIVRLI